jgi:Raf kinase inhibitor-like YbhB/YbcL family protein
MKFLAAICAIFVFVNCTSAEEALRMKLKSPAFLDNKEIPKKFTCDGEGKNPPLEIEDIPKGTRSLVLIVDDPDAPMGTFVHWVVYDIPPVLSIGEDSVPGRQGVNTTGGTDWVPPCPPSGTHRYVFKLYALDAILGLKDGANKKTVEKEMERHVIGKAELIGLYKR